MLNIQHFTKTYGEKKAVDDLSLHIAPGEIYGFIGHNGAGKTRRSRRPSASCSLTRARSRSAGTRSKPSRWPASSCLPTSRTTRTCTIS